MLSTKLRRVVRRVKRIREQEKAIGKIRLFRGKHAGLASSVGVPPEKEPTGNQLSHGSHGVKKALAVAGSVTGTGRAEAPGLPEGQVATQDGKSAFGEGVCQRNQQRGLSIGAGAVSERQAVSDHHAHHGSRRFEDWRTCTSGAKAKAQRFLVRLMQD